MTMDHSPDTFAKLLAAARKMLTFDEAATDSGSANPESGTWQSLDLSEAFAALRAAVTEADNTAASAAGFRHVPASMLADAATRLMDLEDEGPAGEGWKSAELKALIAALRLAAGANP